MSKLFFYYSTMNAGKSTNLLQASFNYKEQGFKTILFTFDKDNRDFSQTSKNPFLSEDKENFSIELEDLSSPIKYIHFKNKKISSRIGIYENAYGFHGETDFKKIFKPVFENNNEKIEKITENSFISSEIIAEIKLEKTKIGAIFVDEAQFLTEKQVKDLAWIVDNYDVPVLCYGLRTDFLGNPFEGSKWLLAWADELKEMKTICKTGKKATFVLRIDKNGNPVKSGEQIQIGGNESYVPVSRKLHQMALSQN